MPSLQPGGLVLVTGVNGYISGVAVQVFLDAGYRVRGTVRDVEKYSWMHEHYGSKFELVSVPEMSADGAFTEAVKGVDAIAHVASAVGSAYVPDPQAVIPPQIRCAVNVLEAAAKEPSVKSVVYTSTQNTMFTLIPGKPYHLNNKMWNEASKAAWTAPQVQSFARGYQNYIASKTEAEQQCFKWVEENKPHFRFNTVLPCADFGTIAAPHKTGFVSSAAVLKLLWDGFDFIPEILPCQHMVDTEDTALLFMAALTQDDIENERILAMAHPYTYSEILSIFRKAAPDHKFPDQIEEVYAGGTVDNTRSEEILKRVKSGKGWSTLEEAVLKAVKPMLESEKEGAEWPKSAAEQLGPMMKDVPSEYRSSYVKNLEGFNY